MGKLVKNFSKRVFLDVDFVTKVGLTFKTAIRFFFSQVLLTKRLTRSYFNVDTVAFKLLQIAYKLLNYH